MTKINSYLDQVTSYTGFIGWVSHFFGFTIRVKCGEDTKYYHKDELMKQLFDAAHCTATHAERKNLSRTFLEVLQPIEGKPITAKKVQKVFDYFKENVEQETITAEALREKFECFKTRKLTVLKVSDKSFLDQLKPGDIVFRKIADSASNIVVTAQKIFKGVTLAPLRDREGYKYSHAAIYIGDGQVAEAMTVPNGGVELRRINMLDPEFLDMSNGTQFLISRPQNSEIGKKAVEYAKAISADCTHKPLEKDAGKKHPHKYAFINALRSLWHSCSFGHFAKQRYLKAYVDAKNNEAPQSFVFFKNFFCSNFVSYCYQAAESQTVIPEIMGSNEMPGASKTVLGKALERGFWSRINSIRYSSALTEKVKFQYDSKWLTPQDLRHFIVGHPNLFADKVLLV